MSPKKKTERELITRSEYARRRGVNPSRITRLVQQGRITLVDGKVDPAQADRDLAGTLDPSQPQKKNRLASAAVAALLVALVPVVILLAAILAPVVMRYRTAMRGRKKSDGALNSPALNTKPAPAKWLNRQQCGGRRLRLAEPPAT